MIDYSFEDTPQSEYRAGIEFAEFFGYGKTKGLDGKGRGAKEMITENDINKRLTNLLKNKENKKIKKDKEVIYEILNEGKISSSEKNKISWFPKNMEEFLTFNKETKENKDEWWKNHRWTKEARVMNNITFGEFNQERFTELGIAIGKIINQIEQQKYEDGSQENNI